MPASWFLRISIGTFTKGLTLWELREEMARGGDASQNDDLGRCRPPGLRPRGRATWRPRADREPRSSSSDPAPLSLVFYDVCVHDLAEEGDVGISVGASRVAVHVLRVVGHDVRRVERELLVLAVDDPALEREW